MYEIINVLRNNESHYNQSVIASCPHPVQPWRMSTNLHIDCVLTHSAVDCGSPPPGTNTSAIPPTSTTFPATVTYTCVSGYEISPGVTTATATCESDGNWTPAAPTCARTFCIVCSIIYLTVLERHIEGVLVLLLTRGAWAAIGYTVV